MSLKLAPQLLLAANLVIGFLALALSQSAATENGYAVCNSNQGRAASQVVQPPASHEKSARSPKGAWDLKGIDEDNVKWIGTLIVRQSDNWKLSGHFDWISDAGDGGREYFEGTFNPATRKLSLSGKSLESETDELVPAKYNAQLSGTGKLLENGAWDSNVGDVVPGKWSAKRLVFE